MRDRLVKPWRAIHWSNGMVTVYDIYGEQIPDLQGPYEMVRDAVLNRSNEKTQFQLGIWEGELSHVPREHW